MAGFEVTLHGRFWVITEDFQFLTDCLFNLGVTGEFLYGVLECLLDEIPPFSGWPVSLPRKEHCCFHAGHCMLPAAINSTRLRPSSTRLQQQIRLCSPTSEVHFTSPSSLGLSHGYLIGYLKRLF